MDFHYRHAPKLISSMSVGLYYSLKVASTLNVPPTGLCPGPQLWFTLTGSHLLTLTLSYR